MKWSRPSILAAVPSSNGVIYGLGKLVVVLLLGGLLSLIFHAPQHSTLVSVKTSPVGLGERSTACTKCRPRFALCFYGLSRSLPWTIQSVQQRVFDVLDRNGAQYDVFVHTYSLEEVNNVRAGEVSTSYEAHLQDYTLLNATRSLVTSQDDFDLAWPDPLTLTQYNWIYYTNEDKMVVGPIIRNVARAYWSMDMAWSLMAEHSLEERVEYDGVVLLRPDVLYHTDIDITMQPLPLPKKTVFVPTFACRPEIVNDRFAYGSVDSMRVLTHRLATLLDADGGQYTGHIDSEWMLWHHLQMHEIEVETVDMELSRVRLSGKVSNRDIKRTRRACSSGKDPNACKFVRAGKFGAVIGNIYHGRLKGP